MRILPVLLFAALALAGCSADDEAGPASADGGGPSASLPDPESGIVTGRLTAASASQVIEIPLREAGHGRLAVALVMTTNLPQSRLALNVTGPDGRGDDVRTSPTLYALPGMRPALSFADPAAGTWSADLRLDDGVAADFEVHWCADEGDAKGPEGNLACHHY